MIISFRTRGKYMRTAAAKFSCRVPRPTATSIAGSTTTGFPVTSNRSGKRALDSRDNSGTIALIVSLKPS